MKIAIYGSRRQQPSADGIARLVTALAAAGADIVMHAKLYDHLIHDCGIAIPGATPTDAPSVYADRALSIGGDGTFLRTVRWAGYDGTPVLGVNTGHLGYLTAFTLGDTHDIIAALLHDICRTEPRTLIEMTATRRGTPETMFALNEVALLKCDNSSMLTLHATLNGHDLATYRADGLIISTPTGSTGYNLSVGGPIIAPTARTLVISPVAAHSLTMRPLVIADDMHITVTTECRTPTYIVSVDGRSMQMRSGTTVAIRRAPFQATVIQRRDSTFADTLRNKLLWASPVS